MEVILTESFVVLFSNVSPHVTMLVIYCSSSETFTNIKRSWRQCYFWIGLLINSVCVLSCEHALSKQSPLRKSTNSAGSNL